MQGEVRVEGEEEDKALADGARGAEHTCGANDVSIGGANGAELGRLPHFFLGKFRLSEVKFWASILQVVGSVGVGGGGGVQSIKSQRAGVFARGQPMDDSTSDDSTPDDAPARLMEPPLSNTLKSLGDIGGV